jgi:hypothetical protein
MTDPEIPPDAVVGTALQLLPIPPHDDGFWDQLERALDAEAPPAVPVEPVRRTIVAAPQAIEPAAPVFELAPDPSLAVVPPALRRASNVVLVAIAAAAVVVVAIAGSTLLEERQGAEQVDSQDDAQQALEDLDRTLKEAEDDGSTVTTLTADGEDASTDAVLAWVADVGSGDGDAAWEAMGPGSKAEMGTQEEFEVLMTDLAEGYGAWAAAEPEEILVTPVLASDEGTLAVVTLIGAVEQEGTVEQRADAFPVRITDGKAVVEPFASAGVLEVVLPEPADDEGTLLPMDADGELVFVVPAGVEAPVLQLDGGTTVVCGQADGTELGGIDGYPGQRCAYDPEGDLELGAHTVTVAFLGSDGTEITAETMRFDAA